MTQERCGAAPDPKIWKEHFTDYRCELERHPADVPHYTSQQGGSWWWRGSIAREEALVLEKIEEARRRRNTPEEKFKRAMEGRW